VKSEVAIEGNQYHALIAQKMTLQLAVQPGGSVSLDRGGIGDVRCA
jgi:hypothetical protein